MQKDSCFHCHKLGHWARDCPSLSPRKTPPSVHGGGSSSRDHPAIQCRCGNGPCLVRVSKTEKNPGRKFYTCPVQDDGQCGFFKWVDELKDSDIKSSPQKASPKCSCGAGICKREKKSSGPNVGRGYFVCPIKKGLGACPFFQWEEEDTLVDTKVNEHGDRSNGYGSPLSTCDSHTTFGIVNNDLRKSVDNLSLEQPGRLAFGLQKVEIARVSPNSTITRTLSAKDDVLVIENRESGKTSDILPANQHHPSPFVFPENEISVLDFAKGSLVMQEAESWDSRVGKKAVVGLMSQSVIRCRQKEFWRQISAAADSNRDTSHQSLGLHFLGWLGRLAFPPSWCLTDHPPAPFFCAIFPSFDPIFVPRDRDMLYPQHSTAMSHCLSNSDNDKSLPSLPGQDVELWKGDLQKSSGLKCASTAMDENEMSTFKKFFEQTRWHVNQLAVILNSTNQSDPDSMTRGACFLFSVLKSIDNNQVKEFAYSSLRFDAIEQSMCNECSMEELIESNNKEKVHFDDVSKVYEKAVADLTASSELEQSLQDEASRVRDLLSQIENQLSCCQAETSEHRTRVDIISGEMVESKNRMEKAEKALELRKQKEEEHLAAKAALEKARIQLQQ